MIIKVSANECFAFAGSKVLNSTPQLFDSQNIRLYACIIFMLVLELQFGAQLRDHEITRNLRRYEPNLFLELGMADHSAVA